MQAIPRRVAGPIRTAWRIKILRAIRYLSGNRCRAAPENSGVDAKAHIDFRDIYSFRRNRGHKLVLRFRPRKLLCGFSWQPNQNGSEPTDRATRAREIETI